MKRVFTAAVLAACVAGVAAVSGPPSAQGAGVRDLRVLVTVGGHGFEHAAFYGMLDALPGVKWKKLIVPDEADVLKPGLEEHYDVIWRYDMVRAFSPAQEKA